MQQPLSLLPLPQQRPESNRSAALMLAIGGVMALAAVVTTAPAAPVPSALYTTASAAGTRVSTVATGPMPFAEIRSQEAAYAAQAPLMVNTAMAATAAHEWDMDTHTSLDMSQPQSWHTTLATVGGVLYYAAVGLGALFLGWQRKSAESKVLLSSDAPEDNLKSLRQVNGTSDTWAMAAVADSEAEGSKTGGTDLKFLIGIAWFFAHQAIGVGNDVIMKFVGGNLAVAQIVFLRFLFATLSMLPFMFASGIDSFKTNRLPLHFARSALLAAGIGLYCTGLTIAPIAVVTTLNFTIPLFTLVLSRFILKETVGPLRWFATLAGFLGVIVVLQPGAMVFNPQWLVVLLGATMFASLDVLNKFFVGKESFWAMIFYTAFFTAAISAYPAYMAWAPVTLHQMSLMAVLGGGANLLLYCLLKSFSMVDASALAPFRYTELLLSALVGFLFFSEIPALTTLAGAGVIIPATLFVVWQESKGGDEEPEPQAA